MTISVAAPDAILSITFGQMHNASVTAAAYDSATTRIRLVSESPTSGQTVTFPAGTTTVQMLIERTTQGGGLFVPFVVHDTCGNWPTFVGGGTGEF